MVSEEGSRERCGCGDFSAAISEEEFSLCSNTSTSSTIGENKVSIPEKYYKAILYVSDTTCNGIAFIMKNEKVNNGSLYPYAVSIDYLEKESGIDFFPELPRMVEKRIEKKCDTVFWKQFGN